MASTNKTTHFELGQFVGTDKPAWLSDYNGDMVKIDLALKTIQDISSGADTKATTALSQISGLNGVITDLQNDVALLNPYKGKVDNLESALPQKAPLESPVFKGNPTVPNQTVGDNSTKIANTKFTIDQIVAMAVRKDNTASPIVVSGLWCGTQGQYDAIGTKDSSVLYFVI